MGLVARRDDNRWAKRLTEWQPRTGKRRRGRQKMQMAGRHNCICGHSLDETGAGQI